MTERHPCPEPKCRKVLKTEHGLALHRGRTHRYLNRQDRDEAALHQLYEKREEGEVKEMKVMLPREHHLRLHGLKLLTGRTISRMVNEALDAYFESGAGKEERGD